MASCRYFVQPYAASFDLPECFRGFVIVYLVGRGCLLGAMKSFVKFTARANVPYSALRGRLTRSVKPIWSHRADSKKLFR